MAKSFDLIAEYREDSGKGASRRLRREGKVPAIIYGGGKPPRSITFDRNELNRKMENESFFSSVLNVKVGPNTRQAILKDVQVHPAKRMVLHLDLQRVLADEKIRMSVPIHFLNEESAIGVKQGGGTVAHLMTEVEVTCLPANLPEYLDIDIGELELDQMLNLSDITLPEGVEISEADKEADRPVVSIHIVKVVEEEPLEGEEVPEGEEAPAVEGEEAAPAEEPKEKGEEGGGD